MSISFTSEQNGSVIENYSKFEGRVMVRLFQVEEVSQSERDSSQVSECLWPEYLWPKRIISAAKRVEFVSDRIS
jgi:hypothetical protein